MNVTNKRGEIESKQTGSQERKSQQQQMEAATNIKDAGKTQFSPLPFLKKYLFRVEHVKIMVNLR